MSGLIPQAAIDDLLDRTDCVEVAARYVSLRGRAAKRIGPCPICSPDSQSKSATRFEVTREKWVCAVCPDGGTAIALVMKAENLDFRAAVERLGGCREIDPVEAERIAAKRKAEQEKREREAAKYREDERAELWRIWKLAKANGRNLIDAYHRCRDLRTPPDLRMRQLPNWPYYADKEKGKPLRILHRGPCLISPIMGVVSLDPFEVRFSGLHFTWIDLSASKGKAVIVDRESGEIMPPKKVRGTKGGGFIIVQGDLKTARKMICGEGRETVQAVYSSMVRTGTPIEGIAFVAAVDLGNLAGKAIDRQPHPSKKSPAGRPQSVPGDVPDLESIAMPVPPQIEELIGLGDGDSDPFATKLAMTRFARRHARPGRKIKIPFPPDGEDFDSWRSK